MSNVISWSMDKRIKEIKKEQRVALARIAYDLIMADNIIEDEEIAKYTKLFGEENNRELFYQAQELTFAKAIKIIGYSCDNEDVNDLVRKLNANQRRNLAEKMTSIVTEIANCDGFCAPTEAILSLAIEYYLKRNNEAYTHYDIQSFKLTDIFIGKRFVLYVDNGANSRSLEIEENYDLIANLLDSIGFQFIYIPKMIEIYEYKGLETFKTISMYLFPDIPEEKVKEVYDKITRLDSKSFVKNYLNDKLGFDINCTSPSFMVMLGRSSVIGKEMSEKGISYETYANFLKINIERQDSVLEVIGRLVQDFNRFVLFKFHIDFNPSKNKLLYHGIHKALFRLVALAKDTPNRYNININTNLNCVFINDRRLPLALGKSAVYVMILCRSFFGDKKGLPINKEFNNLTAEEKESIQRHYEWICSHLSNSELTQRSPLYPNVSNRISEIRKAIGSVVGNKLIGEIQIGSTGAYINTIVSSDNVSVNGVPIKEHPDWGSFM